MNCYDIAAKMLKCTVEELATRPALMAELRRVESYIKEVVPYQSLTDLGVIAVIVDKHKGI